ncbi:hypothetical protein [Candidatus Ichthyocystis hellenicum]|nr:hypothetical protein [Candidatus Ichthyocystis hellenicum]
MKLPILLATIDMLLSTSNRDYQKHELPLEKLSLLEKLIFSTKDYNKIRE